MLLEMKPCLGNQISFAGVVAIGMGIVEANTIVFVRGQLLVLEEFGEW